MRVLGIDCGTERTGFAVVESTPRGHRLIAGGVIVTSPKLALADRLCSIATGLRQTIAEFNPRQAAIEEVFHAVNVKSTLKLAHVRGVAMLTVTEAGLPLGEYSPLEVKMSVVGYGRAEKSQVQLMVRSLLQLKTPEELAVAAKEDAADAMAVAICHANQLTSQMKMGVA